MNFTTKKFGRKRFVNANNLGLSSVGLNQCPPAVLTTEGARPARFFMFAAVVNCATRNFYEGKKPSATPATSGIYLDTLVISRRIMNIELFIIWLYTSSKRTLRFNLTINCVVKWGGETPLNAYFHYILYIPYKFHRQCQWDNSLTRVPLTRNLPI